MNQVTSDDREKAYALLREVVEELHGRGRRGLGAVVKPELVKRSYGGFSERALGFSSFGDFARAAQVAGAIDVYPASNSPDIEMVPPGAQPQSVPTRLASPRSSTGAGESIRPDLWKAFVDWTPGMARAYDRQNDVAVFFPEEPAPLEPANHTQARDAAKNDPARYPRIAPIGIDDQIQWMRDFASEQPEGRARTILEFALSRDRPFREFSQAVREDNGLSRAWQARRKQLVAERIRAWMRDNNLEDVAIFRPAPWADQPASASPSRSAPENLELQAIRDRLHQVIDHMTAADLLRLSIPVEYLIDR